MASASGVSCFSIVASDSPTRVLKLVQLATEGSQHVFLLRRLHLLHVQDICRQLVARNDSTYWLPS